MTVTVLVQNEQTKLAANALDRASTACIAIGIFAPLAALIQGQADPSRGIALSFAGRLAAAAVLHAVARQVLGGLKS